LFHNKRHPLEMGAREVEAFLSHLAVHGHVAASTQNQALAALLFLYREVLKREFGWLKDVVRANKPKRLPEVFSPEEAKLMIDELRGVRWMMGMLLYGGGLRVMECLRLRVKDLCFDRLQLIVRGGKGEKDRVTLLPEAVTEPLNRHLQVVREREMPSSCGGWQSPRGVCSGLSSSRALAVRQREPASTPPRTSCVNG
jgi:site-specific recombinase XerD